jgi:hypothetical protein
MVLTFKANGKVQVAKRNTKLNPAGKEQGRIS